MGLFRKRQIGGIAAEALTFAREAAADSHPNEFMGLMRGTRVDRLEALTGADLAADALVVTDVLVVPATRSSPVEATIRSNLVPNDGRTVGTVHSHPNGVIQPSDADRAAFGRGTAHVILGAPYGPEDWGAFDREGEPRELPVLEVDLEDPEAFFDFDQTDIDRELHR
ncbi:MAG: Mov34/MPN/PAD-1 family protein [Halobacteriaceae archaeon]